MIPGITSRKKPLRKDNKNFQTLFSNGDVSADDNDGDEPRSSFIGAKNSILDNQDGNEDTEASSSEPSENDLNMARLNGHIIDDEIRELTRKSQKARLTPEESARARKLMDARKLVDSILAHK